MSILLIIVTVATSLIGFSSRSLFRQFALSPYEVLHQGRWYQMLTSGFLHADLGHLLMNLISFFFFAIPMERMIGGERLLLLYLGSLLAGSVMTLLLHGKDPRYHAVGASGAVSGVVFGFVLFRPFAPIYIFFIPIGIPALLFAVGYVLLSIYGARRARSATGHAAHLGGAIGGVLLTVLLYPAVVSIFLSHFR
ncbi:MAG: rhomboid family intramembrane serine protease [Candidatus Eisenbacteria bacterium]|nr:rhomboid family intramembrane serine protease [Candidatus Eisenbacteria bacterium]